jgi:hypothetical protein
LKHALTPITEQPAFNIAVEVGTEELGIGLPADEIPLEPIFANALQIGTESGNTFSTINKPIFDEARKLVVYSAERSSYFEPNRIGKYVVIGKTEIGPYDDVWEPIIEDDSVIFGARVDRNLLRVKAKITKKLP